MPLEGGQTRTGVEKEDSAPVGGKKDGDDGQGGQRKTGYEREQSGPVGGNKGGDTGLDAGQKRIGTERDSESVGSKDWPSGRLDKIEEVG